LLLSVADAEAPHLHPASDEESAAKTVARQEEKDGRAHPNRFSG